MTDEDRANYKRQWEQAQNRLPRGHVIHHATWRDGHLSTMSHKPERQPADAGPQFAQRVRRGVQQKDLFG